MLHGIFHEICSFVHIVVRVILALILALVLLVLYIYVAKPVDLSAACTVARLLNRTID